MIKTKRVPNHNLCEACLDYYDDYTVVWVDRGDYCSLYCDDCAKKYDMVITRRVKIRKEKVVKEKNTSKKVKQTK